ncbi:MAG: transcriptional regulator, partial [Rhodobacterales bacterium]
RSIVDLVAASPCSVSDLAKALGITKTAIGQHIAVLEACRLIRSEKRGRVRMCMLERDGFDAIQAWINQHKTHWEAGLDRLGDVIDKERRK